MEVACVLRRRVRQDTCVLEESVFLQRKTSAQTLQARSLLCRTIVIETKMVHAMQMWATPFQTISAYRKTFAQTSKKPRPPFLRIVIRKPMVSVLPIKDMQSSDRNVSQSLLLLE